MAAIQIMVATIGLRSHHRRKNRRCAAATWNVLMSCTKRSISQSLSLSIFQFFNFFGQSIDGRRRRQARRTLPFGSRRRACERPERASARTKSGAMIPRKKQRAKRLPGANAQFFSRRIGPSASGSMRPSEAVTLRLQYRESDEYSQRFASFGAVVHLKIRPNRLHADMLKHAETSELGLRFVSFFRNSDGTNGTGHNESTC